MQRGLFLTIRCHKTWAISFKFFSRVSAKDILYHERFEADEGQSFQANRPVRGGSVHSTSSAERVPKAGKSNEPPKHRHHHGHHNQVCDLFFIFLWYPKCGYVRLTRGVWEFIVHPNKSYCRETSLVSLKTNWSYKTIKND